MNQGELLPIILITYYKARLKCYVSKRLILEVIWFEFYKKDTIYTFR